MFVLFLFLMAITLAAVAGAFSIFGLMAIFPASAHGVMIAAIVIEVVKLCTISFLYQFYDILDYVKKTIAIVFITCAMTVTSIGVYGYLAKGYSEHIAPMANVELQLTTIDSRIDRHQFDINQALQQIELMDAATQRYIELGAVTRSVNVNASREEERTRYNDIINRSQDAIIQLRNERTELSSVITRIETEVAPIQYIADLIFGEGVNTRDKALKWFSLLLVLCIDPFAVALLIFANTAYKYRDDPRVNKEFGGLLDKEKKHDTIDYEQQISTDEILKKVEKMLEEKEKEETVHTSNSSGRIVSDYEEIVDKSNNKPTDAKADPKGWLGQ